MNPVFLKKLDLTRDKAVAYLYQIPMSSTGTQVLEILLREC